jgi:hypothetical protein
MSDIREARTMVNEKRACGHSRIVCKRGGRSTGKGTLTANRGRRLRLSILKRHIPDKPRSSITWPNTWPNAALGSTSNASHCRAGWFVREPYHGRFA